MSVAATTTAGPKVNGQPLGHADETLSPKEWRQRACCELLRQEAVRQGFLAAVEPARPGVPSDAEARGIERLLEARLEPHEPTTQECQRHFDAHPDRYRRPARRHLRHVLFAVTPGVDVPRLRAHAEAALAELNALPDEARSHAFAELARTASNCPSGATGGDLGWTAAADCASEFAAPVFEPTRAGLLPRLVASRHGLHIVDCVAIEAVPSTTFAEAEAAVRMALRQQGWATAMRHYLQTLAEQAELFEIELIPAEWAGS